jgi:hypothetical protein
MTFVLVGGGATGVELAASIAHMITVTFRGNLRQIDPAKSKIILLEGGDRILPTFAETLSKKATKRLEKVGVSVRTGVKVEKVDGEGVIAAGQRIPSATVLWTAGVAASPMAKTLGVKTDRAGRVIVDPSLECPKYSERFRRWRRCLDHTKGTAGAEVWLNTRRFYKVRAERMVEVRRAFFPHFETGLRRVDARRLRKGA